MIRTLATSLKIVSIVLLALAVAGGSIWFFDYWIDREQPMEVGRSVVVSIDDSDDVNSVADKLQDSDLIAYPIYFENAMRFRNMDLVPGSYNLQVGMSTNQIINVIAADAVPSADEEEPAAAGPERPQFNVTFIEGQRIEQNASVLESAGMPGAASEYISLAYDVDLWRGSYWFLEDVPAGGSLEGFLYPDTYTVPSNANVADVIDYQLSTFERNLSDSLVQGWEAQDLSVFEAVTLASIVEREAAVAIERPLIAEVYLNRFHDGTTLNADPAQQYGIGTEEDWWPPILGENIELAYNTPYDTYLAENPGLPPGPISNPGSASLQSVAQPANEGHYYFVTRGDDSGEHRFTFTLDEHNAAMCEEHPDWAQCQ